jgi:hypothetical protein
LPSIERESKINLTDSVLDVLRDIRRVDDNDVSAEGLKLTPFLNGRSGYA